MPQLGSHTSATSELSAVAALVSGRKISAEIISQLDEINISPVTWRSLLKDSNFANELLEFFTDHLRPTHRRIASGSRVSHSEVASYVPASVFELIKEFGESPQCERKGLISYVEERIAKVLFRTLRETGVLKEFGAHYSLDTSTHRNGERDPYAFQVSAAQAAYEQEQAALTDHLDDEGQVPGEDELLADISYRGLDLPFERILGLKDRRFLLSARELFSSGSLHALGEKEQARLQEICSTLRKVQRIRGLSPLPESVQELLPSDEQEMLLLVQTQTSNTAIGSALSKALLPRGQQETSATPLRDDEIRQKIGLLYYRVSALTHPERICSPEQAPHLSSLPHEYQIALSIAHERGFHSEHISKELARLGIENDRHSVSKQIQNANLILELFTNNDGLPPVLEETRGSLSAANRFVLEQTLAKALSLKDPHLRELGISDETIVDQFRSIFVAATSAKYMTLEDGLIEYYRDHLPEALLSSDLEAPEKKRRIIYFTDLVHKLGVDLLESSALKRLTADSQKQFVDYFSGLAAASEHAVDRIVGLLSAQQELTRDTSPWTETLGTLTAAENAQLEILLEETLDVSSHPHDPRRFEQVLDKMIETKEILDAAQDGKRDELLIRLGIRFRSSLSDEQNRIFSLVYERGYSKEASAILLGESEPDLSQKLSQLRSDLRLLDVYFQKEERVRSKELANLPGRQRAAIQARFEENTPTVEVGEKLSPRCSTPRVQQLLNAGIRNIQLMRKSQYKKELAPSEEELPDEQRRAIARHIITDGYTIGETASLLGLQRSIVSIQLELALKELGREGEDFTRARGETRERPPESHWRGFTQLLHGRAKEAIERIYGDGETIREFAASFGTSPNAVSQLLKVGDQDIELARWCLSDPERTTALLNIHLPNLPSRELEAITFCVFEGHGFEETLQEIHPPLKEAELAFLLRRAVSYLELLSKGQTMREILDASFSTASTESPPANDREETESSRPLVGSIRVAREGKNWREFEAFLTEHQLEIATKVFDKHMGYRAVADVLELPLLSIFSAMARVQTTLHLARTFSHEPNHSQVWLPLVEHLQPRDREVWMLRYSEKLSLSEIGERITPKASAEQLEKRLGTITKVLFDWRENGVPEQEQTWNATVQLTAKQRRVLELIDRDGLNQTEAADALGVTNVTVGAAYNRATELVAATKEIPSSAEPSWSIPEPQLEHIFRPVAVEDFDRYSKYLSASQRQLIQYVYKQKYSYSETARALGVKKTTVDSGIVTGIREVQFARFFTESEERMQQVLPKLPKRHQEILEAVYHRGMTIEEASEVLEPRGKPQKLKEARLEAIAAILLIENGEPNPLASREVPAGALAPGQHQVFSLIEEEGLCGPEAGAVLSKSAPVID
ncbi:MAG: helix-turn-helix domain-containing protein, partial [Bdellovibrionales bacterium]|nr:helix-turn-helix domain-containing protein [Bdellovibrionales bacterium]